MDDRRFDDLTRTLAASTSRRGALKAGAAALAGLIGTRRQADAQVTQAQCGNQVCASNPGGCNPGCVCCAYSNGNSRCRPPGTCSGGQEVVPATTTTTAPTTTSAPTTTAAPTTAAPTTTAQPTTTAAPTTAAPTTAAPTTTTTAPTTTTTTTAPPSGVCVDAPLCPDDGLACTHSHCDPVRGCVHDLLPGFCLIFGQCFADGEMRPDGCAGCDTSVSTTAFTRKPNGTICNESNLCVAGAACQNGTCTGGTATVCEQPNEICNDFVCDPVTGSCIYTPLSGGAFDRKGCDVCVSCIDGACASGVDTLDCGPCATCDRTLQACVAKPVGSDCGSTCSQRATCSATGTCTLSQNTDGCFNFDVCSAKVCNESTAQCEETGAKDGQACGGDLCKECRGGECVPKTCSSCEQCNPATGLCVQCEPCCRGVCGLEVCGGPFSCCGGPNACCDSGGDLVCRNRSRTCEGVCFVDPVTCCGTVRDGTLRTCPAGETCCFGANEPFCCPAGHTCCQIGCCPPGQVCGAFGCQAE